MTYDSSYSLKGEDIHQDYDRSSDLEEDYEPKPTELGRVKLRKKPVKLTDQEKRDRERLEWLRNIREE